MKKKTINRDRILSRVQEQNNFICIWTRRIIFCDHKMLEPLFYISGNMGTLLEQQLFGATSAG